MSDFSLTTGFPQAEDTERLLLARLGLRSGLSFRSTSLTTALASASRTATTASADISTAGARGILIVCQNTTTDATLQINLGVCYLTATQPFALAASGNYAVNVALYRAMLVHPQIATAAPVHGYTWGQNNVQAALPGSIRLAVAHSNANPLTYSLSYILLD